MKPRVTLYWLAFASMFVLREAAAAGAPVVMISIDALRPDAVLQADRHGLKIPTLRRFVSEGAFAESVVGVYPTVTIPSHTTLVTGVNPAVHGIVDNDRFEPLRAGSVPYGWGRDVKVRTLWQAASDAGLKTASVWWPMTADMPGIDYDIPALPMDAGAPHNNMRLLEALAKPAGYLATLESGDESTNFEIEDLRNWDRLGERFAERILLEQHPQFITMHFVELDGVQHEHGVFQPQGAEALERLDALIAKLMQATLRVDPSTVFVVVSDHGCADLHTQVNLVKAFAEAGLIKLSRPDSTGKRAVVDWQAFPWNSAVYLRNVSDTQVRNRTRKLLESLRRPELGIDDILEGESARGTGGLPDAAFIIKYRIGFAPAYGSTADEPLLQASKLKGTHGYFPDELEMRSSFFLLGPHLPRKGNLGVIHMTQIASSVAQLLGVTFEAGGPSVF